RQNPWQVVRGPVVEQVRPCQRRQRGPPYADRAARGCGTVGRRVGSPHKVQPWHEPFPPTRWAAAEAARAWDGRGVRRMWARRCGRWPRMIFIAARFKVKPEYADRW